VKHKVLAEMEEILPKHAIFASNTSAIPIADIAKGAKR
jgi:3-hydroxyacyl-CoA dehydrogenase